MIDFFFNIAQDMGLVNEAYVAKKFAELHPGRWHAWFEEANTRTLPQNAYLHGVLIPEFRKALVGVGYNEVKTDVQAKLIMKKMFLTQQVANEQTGEVLEYVKDTHELTTVEMSTLIEEVIQFAAENMNYQIPYPNEQLMIAL